MDEQDSYRFHDAYSLQDAAALICGFMPSIVATANYCPYIRVSEGDNRNDVFQGVLKGLVHAVQSGTLAADAQYLSVPLVHRGELGWEPVGSIIPSATTVSRDDLVAWLASRGMTTGFFFPEAPDTPNYLNPEHPRYSAKLAAAVKVWQAMEDDNLLSGKSAPDAMSEWLTSRYRELGLVWNSEINKTGIGEVAKVANWQTTGGSPKTPTGD